MLTVQPPVFPHIAPLAFPPAHFRRRPPNRTPCRPPGERPPADGAGPQFPGPGPRSAGRPPMRDSGEHRLPEVAAVSPRPAFPQHIALAVKGQTAIFPVIVGAPFHYKGADSGLFLTGQLAQNITSRPVFQKALKAGAAGDAAPVGTATAPGALRGFSGRGSRGRGRRFISRSKGFDVKFILRPPFLLPHPTGEVVILTAAIVLAVFHGLFKILAGRGGLLFGAVNLEVPPGPAAEGQHRQHQQERPRPAGFFPARAPAPAR